MASQESPFAFDLVVIGAGSGGVSLARRAASYGARVAICEEWSYGGTCVHRGCIPKKLLMYAAMLREEMSLLPFYGFEPGVAPFHWDQLIAAKDKELDRLDGVYKRLLDSSGVVRKKGHASLVDEHTVQVGDEQVQGRFLVIATGARPFLPDVPGIEHALVSDDLFHLKELPPSVTLMGSGYIGLEFATIFHGLGSEVKVMYRSDLPLPGFDGDVRSVLADELTVKGLGLKPGSHLREIRRVDHGLEIVTSSETWTTHCFVAAAGRRPNTEGLNLEKIGVRLGGGGEIEADELSQTSVPSIYAIGDVCGGIQLTPYAIVRGRGVAERLFNNPDYRFEPRHVPTAVFTLPAVGTVGMTEEDARREFGDDVEIYRARFRTTRYTITDKPDKVLTKLVVRRSDRKVLGGHMVGGDAAELVQLLGVALTCGATKEQFDQTLAVHPTGAEEFVLMREPVAAS